MADGIDIDQTTTIWQIKFHSGGGTALPATIWGSTTNKIPLIPRRLKAVGTTTAAAAKIIIQAAGIDAFVADAGGANNDLVEQTPHGHESWIGPIVVTQFDAGWELEIYI